MACIDKTYVFKEELREVVDWCLSVGEQTLEDGTVFDPFWMISVELDENYNPVNDQEEYILWNTPRWFDRWLWMHCPLDFIRERLKYQYDEDALKEFENYVYKDPNDNIQLGRQHYTFLKEAKWHGWKLNASKYFIRHFKQYVNAHGRIIAPFSMKIYTSDGERLVHNNNRWYKDDGMLPTSCYFDWEKYHKKIPTKKSIIRELRRYYIPSGSIVTISGRWKDMDWKILVK